MADSGHPTSLCFALLDEVFKETCAKNDTALDSSAAMDLAMALVAAFESGIQDKAGLLPLLDNQYSWAA